MNTFVTACRREWRRLGVPEAVAREMAADLEADLDEAAADGVSPEEVLGNGVFDPESFAAAWARARGVADDLPAVGGRPGFRGRSWVLVAGAVVSSMVALVGLVAAVGREHSSVAVASVAFHKVRVAPMSGALMGPQRLLVMHGGAPLVAGGVLLLGLLGLAVTVWLARPRVSRRRRSTSDPDIGMPSYL